MIILFLVFVVQFSVSSACLAINKEQQVRLITVLHYNICILIHWCSSVLEMCYKYKIPFKTFGSNYFLKVFNALSQHGCIKLKIKSISIYIIYNVTKNP